jgi:hypothetical protein
MNDKQVEKFIWDEIKKRDITIYDMLGLPNHGVDPTPDEEITEIRRSRSNRFHETFGCDRIKELLSVGEHNPYDDYTALNISVNDLFRFWWDRCVDQEIVIDDVLEDIYSYFTEQMRPPEKEQERMDMDIDFKVINLRDKAEELPPQIPDLDEIHPSRVHQCGSR